MHVYMYIDIYLCIYTYVPIYTFDFHYNQCASDQKDSNSQMFSSASATALRRFASVTAHIIFIHITSVEKPVHIFMAKNRVSKSCLIAELCYHPFVHFNCAPICIFGPNQKQCARY